MHQPLIADQAQVFLFDGFRRHDVHVALLVEPIFRAEAIQVCHQLNKVTAALVGFDQCSQAAIALEGAQRDLLQDAVEAPELVGVQRFILLP